MRTKKMATLVFISFVFSFNSFGQQGIVCSNGERSIRLKGNRNNMSLEDLESLCQTLNTKRSTCWHYKRSTCFTK